MPEINGVNLPFIPIGGADTLKKIIKPIENKAISTKFDDLLSQELLKFSGHAQNRMVSRDINLNDVDMLRLDEAVEKAKNKGSQESLVILDDNLFIVAVNNRTVVTMFDKKQMDTDVITNIDSAVFA
jgi:flagellar operon protein